MNYIVSIFKGILLPSIPPELHHDPPLGAVPNHSDIHTTRASFGAGGSSRLGTEQVGHPCAEVLLREFRGDEDQIHSALQCGSVALSLCCSGPDPTPACVQGIYTRSCGNCRTDRSQQGLEYKREVRFSFLSKPTGDNCRCLARMLWAS